jgi:DNA modification methylase
MSHRIEHGDCLELLPSLSDTSVDAVITDPPYPEIDRDYGRISEADWHELIDKAVAQARRVLKPSGSMVCILQPNYEKLGRMRLWLWEFLVRTAKSWNLIQNAYCWNRTAMPSAGCDRRHGLLRPSVRYCLWFGPPDCHRDQQAVLWTASQGILAEQLEDRCLHRQPSGYSVRQGRAKQTVLERGGSTPFNLLPVALGSRRHEAGYFGHGAGTPFKLCEWWVKYICPPGGTVLDPFAGVASVGVAAVRLGRSYIGMEKEGRYCDIARSRLEAAVPSSMRASAGNS